MKLYKFDIRNLSDKEYIKWYSLMSPEKQSRVDGFKFEDDKKRTVAGEMLAKTAISENYGVELNSLIVLHTKNGKPFVEIENCHISISHSHNLVVCAVSHSPVGVDTELVREIDLKIANRVCTKSELDYINGDVTRFFEVWTSKEAYIKAKGSGFSDHNVNTLELDKQTIRYKDYIISIVGSCL